nr:hypothetical protein [Escherichia coli]
MLHELIELRVSPRRVWRSVGAQFADQRSLRHLLQTRVAMIRSMFAFSLTITPPHLANWLDQALHTVDRPHNRACNCVGRYVARNAARTSAG